MCYRYFWYVFLRYIWLIQDVNLPTSQVHRCQGKCGRIASALRLNHLLSNVSCTALSRNILINNSRCKVVSFTLPFEQQPLILWFLRKLMCMLMVDQQISCFYCCCLFGYTFALAAGLLFACTSSLVGILQSIECLDRGASFFPQSLRFTDGGEGLA